jgi:BirA family biotin operon repressor/biotin-[acetyl-CoA-carboxylase] ligase
LIHFVSKTGSTSADVATRLRAGEMIAEGDWLIADRQNAGRGRQGREWFDGAGNFMGSTLVNSRPGDPALPSLALVAGLAVQQVISAYLPAVLLKWPNDVMVDAAKVAGVLLERQGDAVVVGIGVNLVSAPIIAGRETASLSDFGAAPDRNAFAAALAQQFAAEIERWRNFGIAPIVARWLAAGHPLGTPLSVGEPGEVPLDGNFAGLTDEGSLLLRLADGSMQTIQAGEVRLAAANR